MSTKTEKNIMIWRRKVLQFTSPEHSPQRHIDEAIVRLARHIGRRLARERFERAQEAAALLRHAPSAPTSGATDAERLTTLAAEDESVDTP